MNPPGIYVSDIRSDGKELYLLKKMCEISVLIKTIHGFTVFLDRGKKRYIECNHISWLAQLSSSVCPLSLQVLNRALAVF